MTLLGRLMLPALALAFALGACKSDPDPEPGIDGSAVTSAKCDYRERCDAALGRIYSSTQACADVYLASHRDCTPIRYDNTQAEIDACVSFLQGLSCDVLLYEDDIHGDTPCGRLLLVGEESRGIAGAGQSCAAADCQPGFYCEPSLTNPGQCPVCRERKPVDSPCPLGLECTRDAYCASNTHTCTATQPDATLCVFDAQCASQWCDSATHTCKTPLGRDAVCSQTDRCAGLLRCLGGTCTDLRGVTESCADSFDCQADLVCFGGQCTSVAACGQTGHTGDPCPFDTSCASGYYCTADIVDPACQALAGAGDECVDDEACIGGYFCDGGICNPLKADGADCSGDWECVSDNCDPASYTCAALSPNGAICTAAWQCVSGFCDAGHLCADKSTCVMP